MNSLSPTQEGRIINILDSKARHHDHLPYTISKAGLAALSLALAQNTKKKLTVHSIALGPILPPTDGTVDEELLDTVPEWSCCPLESIQKTLVFLLTAPEFINGEVINVDGGCYLS